MRRLLSIAMLQFRLVVKNKGSLLLMFAMPLAFTAIFGLLMGGSSGPVKVPVAVVDLDGSFASQQVIALLEEESGIKVRSAAEGELDRLFVDHKIEAGAIIPAGFGAMIESGRAPELLVATAPGGNMQVAIQPLLTRAGTVVTENLTLARRLNPADPAAEYAKVAAERKAAQVGLTVTPEAGRPSESGSQLQSSALGMIVMFLMMSMVAQSGALLTDRTLGTWGRLLTAPTTRLQLMGGYLLSLFLTGCFQTAVLVGATRLIFQIDWGPLPQLAAVSALVVLCAAGFGLFLAGFVRSAEQQRAVGSGLVVITCFLGGVFWPLDLMGKGMQLAGRLTPQAWAMEGFREVMLRGGAWANLVTPMAALAGLAVLFMGIGLARVRFE